MFVFWGRHHKWVCEMHFNVFPVSFIHLFVCVCVCVCVMQIHGGGHADALQHQIQLQEEGGSDDCCGVVPLFRHLLPFAVWPQQHR